MNPALVQNHKLDLDGRFRVAGHDLDLPVCAHRTVSRHSVTDKIMRTAPCPVLTVHPHDRNDAATAHAA